MKGKNYQLVVITPVLPLKESGKVEEEIKKALLDEKAKVQKVENWGIKDFAYPIRQLKRGSYWIYHFQSPSFQSEKFGVFLNRKKEIIRYLLLKEES